ncbi:MAG: helix-turn-helix transcriptional regulator [Rhodothermaceae bacterium]|nr:helix-turn-helix transcriptional regulator [Rhodothermaceae bacterium]
MLRYEEDSPPEPLHPFVQDLWSFTVPAAQPPGLHHIPPDGCVSLVVTKNDEEVQVVVVGPHVSDLAVPVYAGAQTRGLRMRPEAAGILVDFDPRLWIDRTGPLALASTALAEAIGPITVGVEQGFRQFMAVLVERASHTPPPDPLVIRAVRRVEAAIGDLRVGSLARSLGVSMRTLQRRFAAATGLTPKQFIRVRRFRYAVANVLQEEPEAWGRVAAEHGYADQAHFAREVASLTGAPPTALHERLRQIEHIGVRP